MTPQEMHKASTHDVAIMELYSGDEATRPGYEYAKTLLLRRIVRCNSAILREERKKQP